MILLQAMSNPRMLIPAYQSFLLSQGFPIQPSNEGIRAAMAAPSRQSRSGAFKCIVLPDDLNNTADTETYVYTEMTAAHPGSTVRACFRPAAADGVRECVEARVGEAATTPRPPSPK